MLQYQRRRAYSDKQRDASLSSGTTTSMYVSVGDFSGPDGNNQGGQQILNRITYGLALSKQRRATVVVLTIVCHTSGASGHSIFRTDCSCLAKILPFGSLTFPGRWYVSP